MTATDYARTIGTIAGTGKIHLAHGRSNRQTILCRFGPATETTTHTVAVIPEDADVCNVLHAHQIKMSRLCKNCFSIGLRKRYLATMRTASDTRAQLVTETENRSTGALAIALEALCYDGPRDEAERLVCGVIVSTLYDRHPEIAAAYNAWIDSESDEDAEDVVTVAALALALR